MSLHIPFSKESAAFHGDGGVAMDAHGLAPRIRRIGKGDVRLAAYRSEHGGDIGADLFEQHRVAATSGVALDHRRQHLDVKLDGLDGILRHGLSFSTTTAIGSPTYLTLPSAMTGCSKRFRSGTALLPHRNLRHGHAKIAGVENRTHTPA